MVPDDLLTVARLSAAWVVSLPEELDADVLPLAVAGHVAAGSVKVVSVADEKARTAPFRGTLDFRVGDRADDALRRAAILTIALALDGARVRAA